MEVNDQLYTPATLRLEITTLKLYIKLGGPWGLSVRDQETLSVEGFELQTLQPVKTPYNDVIPACLQL